MIRVSLTYLVLIYLLLMLGPIITAWLFTEWRRQRRERAAFIHVIRCGICAHEFKDETNALLARCPHCSSLNERYRLSRL